MVEIKQSMIQEAELEDEIVAAEDSGRPIPPLLGSVERIREARDALFAEWCAELRTIHACESALQSGSSTLPAVAGFQQAEIRSQLSETHVLNLMHVVVRDTSVVTGGAADIPPGTREMRDELLLRVARANGVDEFFYRMDATTKRHALDQFGDLLIDRAPSAIIQDLIDGRKQFENVPNLDTAMAAFVQQLRKPAPKGRLKGRQ